MATISSTITLQDNMTAVLNRQANATNTLVDRLQQVDRVTDNFDLPSQWAAANGSLTEMTGQLGRMISLMEENNSQLAVMNENISQVTNEANNAKGAFGGMGSVIKGAMSFLSVKAVKDFTDKVFALNNTQLKAEVQLNTVLKNQGSGVADFEALKARAADIQGYTMYGDEAMISGAAEISTYIKDTEAISQMMGTLANYAAGMSGGGEVGTEAMTEYATQLGKALDGTYDSLKKKGFELSDEQKKIIENGTDMQKALVLDEVINQSWAGLAENMRNTPTGAITALNNTIGDIGETIGARITPAFMELVDRVEAFVNSSGFDSFLTIIVDALNMAFGVLEFGVGIIQTVSDNWSAFAPIILGVAAALLVYKGAMIAVKVATAIATAVQKIHNAVLAANPVMVIVTSIIILIAAIYSVCQSIAKFTGIANSGFGVICGGVMVVIAFFKNLGLAVANIALGIWEALCACCENVWAVFHNVFCDLQSMWYGFLKVVMDVVKGVCDVLNYIPFVNIDTSGLVAASQDYANKQAEAQNSKTAFKDVGEAFNKGASTFDAFSDGWVEDAFQSGAAWGDGVVDGINSMLDGFNTDVDTSALTGDMNAPAGTADDPIHTNVDNDINIADEDLQLMRDVAEARYVQNFVTLTPTVQVSGNTINEKVDVDYVVGEIENRLTNEIAASAEGIYG